MGLYINGIEYNILNSNKLLTLEINPYNPITNNLKLFSSDNYILKDKNGIYLTTVEYIQSLSSDNFILTDLEDKYLTIKKG